MTDWTHHQVDWRDLFAHFPDPSAWRLEGEPVSEVGRMIHALRRLRVQVKGCAPA